MKGIPEMNGESYQLRYLLPKMSKSNYALWMSSTPFFKNKFLDFVCI